MDLSGSVVPKPKNKGGAPKGRVISEATREALKKGFEKLKSIREAKKKEKEEKVMKEAEVKKEVLNSNEPVAPVVPLETPAPSKPKRQRMKTVSKNEFLSFKDDILKVIDGKLTPQKVEAPPPTVIAPPPAPAPVPVPVVEKVLSGNDLLNKIFFNR